MESSNSDSAAGSRSFLTPAQSLSGRYELLGRLGSGGMAEVYLARAVGLDGYEFEKIVVLKRVLPERMDDRRYAAMFRDEARVAATLEHPNIVHTHDIGIKDDECFFTMEYLHGEDLKAILAAAAKAREQLPLELAMQIAVGCAAGLHHAHDQTDYSGRPLEIVHRDVSPSNIIVTRQSGVKLIDFGIAKAASGKEETGVGVLKGKVAYMSPEQCRGEVLDRRSDIFALGIVLYEMITMERPYKAGNVLGTVHKLLGEEPPPPTTVRRDCPTALERIVVKALEKDRSRRYQSAFEMQEELELVTRDCQLHALPGSLGRYLEHLFGVKVHPWRQHVKRPPAMPRWAWTEMDSTLTGAQSQRGTPMPELPSAPAPPVTMPETGAVITAQMPMPLPPAGPAPFTNPTGGYVPVHFDDTYASETAAQLGVVPMPARPPRRATRFLLIGGVVGALVVLGGLRLFAPPSLASTPASLATGILGPKGEAPSPPAITPNLRPLAVAGPAPEALPVADTPAVAHEVTGTDDGAVEPEPDLAALSGVGSEPAGVPGSGAQAARLIDRARRNLLGNPKAAYRDAKAAHDLRPTQTALQLMGQAACRSKQEDRAIYAYRRLRGSAQRALRSSCLQLGIDLE